MAPTFASVCRHTCFANNKCLTFCITGPDTLSVNSLSAQHIYSAQAHMPKAESYRAPGHNKPVAMFFKQPFEKLHSDRRKIWSTMFTKEG